MKNGWAWEWVWVVHPMMRMATMRRRIPMKIYPPVNIVTMNNTHLYAVGGAASVMSVTTAATSTPSRRNGIATAATFLLRLLR